MTDAAARKRAVAEAADDRLKHLREILAAEKKSLSPDDRYLDDLRLSIERLEEGRKRK